MRERTTPLPGKLVNYSVQNKGKNITTVYIEGAEIFRAFSVYSLTFGLHTYASNFVLLSVA